ncbi:diiron oxygenase [Micromonospora sp. NPDC049175]|uniref:diiron oxygenase n=1 Tax=Micromonospora sp. NPDC049175 TaxID=3364266 RepID=UPI003722B178
MSTDFLKLAVRSAEQATCAPRGLADIAVGAEYRSRFDKWDRNAAVRSRPLRKLEPATTAQVYFPPELVPVRSHPLVAELGDSAHHRLLVHALYQYLHFTSELEDTAVIPVTMELSRGRSGLQLPAGMRRDAFNIVTDEAWHAQFSYELHTQIVENSAVPSPAFGVPQFVGRLATISNRLRTHIPALGPLLFAVVSETLISSLLAEVPHDRRLPTAVRQTVADHAVDEGRHHAYFRDVLRLLWRALTPAERSMAGPWLPAIVMAFLEPDYAAVADSLALLGLRADQIEAVLTESYPRDRVLATVAAAARSTISYCEEVGALSDAATRDAFAPLLSAAVG